MREILDVNLVVNLSCDGTIISDKNYPPPTANDFFLQQKPIMHLYNNFGFYKTKSRA